MANKNDVLYVLNQLQKRVYRRVTVDCFLGEKIDNHYNFE